MASISFVFSSHEPYSCRWHLCPWKGFGAGLTRYWPVGHPGAHVPAAAAPQAAAHPRHLRGGERVRHRHRVRDDGRQPQHRHLAVSRAVVVRISVPSGAPYSIIGSTIVLFRPEFATLGGLVGKKMPLSKHKAFKIIVRIFWVLSSHISAMNFLHCIFQLPNAGC